MSPLFPISARKAGGIERKTHKMIKRDLAAARQHWHFITSLERAGVRPKVAQMLARHSDIRLTLGIYAHAELTEQTAAIATLPGVLEE
jgi:hypothetical protein